MIPPIKGLAAATKIKVPTMVPKGRRSSLGLRLQSISLSFLSLPMLIPTCIIRAYRTYIEKSPSVREAGKRPSHPATHPTAKKATTMNPCNVSIMLLSCSGASLPPASLSSRGICRPDAGVSVACRPAMIPPRKKNFRSIQATTQLPNTPATEISSAFTPKVPRLFTTCSFAPTCRPKNSRRSQMV